MIIGLGLVKTAYQSMAVSERARLLAFPAGKEGERRSKSRAQDMVQDVGDNPWLPYGKATVGCK